MILLALVSWLAAVDEDAITVTLAFERMHCDECKSELEASVRKMQGFKGVSFLGSAVLVLFDEKQPVPAFNRLPKDLSLRAVTLAIRGTVSFAGEKATLVARSGSTYALANPDKSKQDHLGDLKKKLGGKSRFTVSGTIGGDGKTILLQSFQAADWKD
jgi:copper chaperone CopZ